MKKNLSTATFGGGCFWCTEAVFQALTGVEQVLPGYMGGEKPNPTYFEVCNGDTGHVEIVQIRYDPELVSFEELLLIFFKTHNPTTLNRQGNDVGTQYRSVVFYHDEAQKKAAEDVIARLESEQVFADPIVTAIEPAAEFFEAEDYHHNYYRDNRLKPYCSVIIQPKLEKLLHEFRDKIREELL
ncbi:MAG: peptide-methionine (S)-S-oxide reductase MsrA [Mucilaginibacter polytrichastri]|nr:peptide-methionine (S)-S-oxide reductase MsrA [Mucilaginibacter polytrichastri]